MGKFIDLAGEVFGRLTVLELYSKNPKTKWTCLCNCGNETIVTASNLKSGHTKSCGCLEIESRENHKDLSNIKFGRLTVIKEYDKAKTGQRRWLCLCDCGLETIVIGSNLKNGHTKSCGCYNLEKTKEVEDLTGLKFGRLLVLQHDENYLSKFGNKFSAWICQCDCGNIVSIRAATLKSGDSTSCGCYLLERQRETNLSDLQYKCFGNLKVIELSHFEAGKGAFWLCECSCGNEIIVLGSNLSSGNTKSCGCLRESWIAKEVKEYFNSHYDAEKEHKMLRNPETSAWLKCDIYIGEKDSTNGIYVEINDSQHYKFIPFWHKTKEKFEYNKNLDEIKKQYAKENGFYIEVDLRKIKTTQDAIDYILNKIN